LDGENLYLFHKCQWLLERVSITGVQLTYKIPLSVEDEEILYIEDCYEWITEPILQKVIMKFVRMTPTLRWLRSDLTDENVETLRKERPDTYFVRN
jgi:hypothetical protein